jgi:Regulator of G protein signaling domain
MISSLPDPRWLAGQVLRIALRRKGGALIGHGDLPLRDAFYCCIAELPISQDFLTLPAVLEHPVLARAFAAYTASMLSSESLDFYRAHLAYQELCAAGPHIATAEVRIAAAHTIAETFIWPSAHRMVSVSGTVIGKLRTALTKANEAYGIALPSSLAPSSSLGLPSGNAEMLGLGPVVNAAPGNRTSRSISNSTASSLGVPPPAVPAPIQRSGPASTLSTAGGSAPAALASSPEEAAALVEKHVASDLFHDAAVEVYKSLERDSLPGFRAAYGRIVQACGLHYGANSSATSSSSASSTSASSATGGVDATAPITTPCAPFTIPLIRDGCTVGVLRGALQLSPQDILGDRFQRLRELQRFLRRRSTMAAARRNTRVNNLTAISGTTPGATGTTAPASSQGVVGGVLIEDNYPLLPSVGSSAALVSSVGDKTKAEAGKRVGIASVSSSANNDNLLLGSVSLVTRLPEKEQGKVKSVVDSLLKPFVHESSSKGASSAAGNAANSTSSTPSKDGSAASVPASALPAPPGTEAFDDFLLLADVLLGAAVTTADSGAKKSSPSPANAPSDALNAASVLAKATTMALGSSAGDKSVHTRALRSLLQLAMQRIQSLEEKTGAAEGSGTSKSGAGGK